MGLLRLFKSKSTQCLSDLVHNDFPTGKISIDIHSESIPDGPSSIEELWSDRF